MDEALVRMKRDECKVKDVEKDKKNYLGHKTNNLKRCIQNNKTDIIIKMSKTVFSMVKTYNVENY